MDNSAAHIYQMPSLYILHSMPMGGIPISPPVHKGKAVVTFIRPVNTHPVGPFENGSIRHRLGSMLPLLLVYLPVT